MLVFDRFVLNLPIVFCLVSSCLACFALQQQSVRPALIETTGFNQNNNQTEKKKIEKKNIPENVLEVTLFSDNEFRHG